MKIKDLTNALVDFFPYEKGSKRYELATYILEVADSEESFAFFRKSFSRNLALFPEDSYTMHLFTVSKSLYFNYAEGPKDRRSVREYGRTYLKAAAWVVLREWVGHWDIVN
jgi:hypothetical protein